MGKSSKFNTILSFIPTDQTRVQSGSTSSIPIKTGLKKSLLQIRNTPSYHMHCKSGLVSYKQKSSRAKICFETMSFLQSPIFCLWVNYIVKIGGKRNLSWITQQQCLGATNDLLSANVLIIHQHPNKTACTVELQVLVI